MAESLKALRRRIRSVASTQKVTSAMEMVSAAKLRRAQGALMSARPYSRRLSQLLGHLAPMAEGVGHPLFSQRRVRRSTLVLFTADRGLCGSYNSSILRMAEEQLKSHSAGSVELVCVGRRGAEYFGKRRFPIVESITDMGGTLDHTRSDSLSDLLRDRFLSGHTDEVFLLYNSFVSAARFVPRYEKFLDLDASDLMRNHDFRHRMALDYIFEPSREAVFEDLLPAYLRSKIFIVCAEAFTSEHGARMMAMNNATTNCEEMVDQLTLRLNRARQAAITGDLIDIIGGAEALQ